MIKSQKFICPCCKHMTKVVVDGGRIVVHKPKRKNSRLPNLREQTEMDEIKNVILNYFQISDERFFSKDRSRELVLARQYFFYLVDYYLNLKRSKVGFYIGMDRTTVIYGVQQITGFLEVGCDDARHIEVIKSLISPSKMNNPNFKIKEDYQLKTA